MFRCKAIVPTRCMFSKVRKPSPDIVLAQPSVCYYSTNSTKPAPCRKLSCKPCKVADALAVHGGAARNLASPKQHHAASYNMAKPTKLMMLSCRTCLCSVQSQSSIATFFLQTQLPQAARSSMQSFPCLPNKEKHVKGCSIAPGDLHFVGAEALRAGGVLQARGLPLLEGQEPRPRYHGAIVDAVPVVRRVQAPSALRYHHTHHLLGPQAPHTCQMLYMHYEAGSEAMNEHRIDTPEVEINKLQNQDLQAAKEIFAEAAVLLHFRHCLCHGGILYSHIQRMPHSQARTLISGPFVRKVCRIARKAGGSIYLSRYRTPCGKFCKGDRHVKHYQ